MRGKKVIITGGAGFIGSYIAEELVKQGADVVVIDNEFSGFKSNLDNVYKHTDKGSLEYIKADICDKRLNLIFKRHSPIDIVFHEAAVVSVPMSVKEPYRSFKNNVMGTLNVLLCAKENKVGRVIFASSSSVYGDDKTFPKKEEKTDKTLSPYALTKKTCEEMMRQFYELYNLKTVSLRYFNVFGPRQNPNGPYAAVIPIFISRMLKGERPQIFGDGKQSRDFTFVKNVVDGNLLFAKLPAEKVCGKVFNLSCGGSISVNDLVKELNKLMGKNIKPEYFPIRKGDIMDSCADISKARKLGFKPKVSFSEGLKITLDYYRNKLNYK